MWMNICFLNCLRTEQEETVLVVVVMVVLLQAVEDISNFKTIWVQPCL